MKLQRTIEQWRHCDPKTMAYKMSEVAITYAFEDAKEDILTLHNGIETLRKENATLRDMVHQLTFEKRNMTQVSKSELLRIARLIEDFKQPCGWDPETPQAIRNGQYQSIALMIRALLADASEA